jgi:hypothetical protein
VYTLHKADCIHVDRNFAVVAGTRNFIEKSQIGAHEGGHPLRISDDPIADFCFIGRSLVTDVDETPCLGI